MSAVCGCMENMVRCVLYGVTNQTKEATMVGLELDEIAEREKQCRGPSFVPSGEPNPHGQVSSRPSHSTPLTTPCTCNRG